MIVDLLRNDIGKVCKGGSVKILERKTLESYRNVFYPVSTIEGIIEDNKALILNAAGSISETNTRNILIIKEVTVLVTNSLIGAVRVCLDTFLHPLIRNSVSTQD